MARDLKTLASRVCSLNWGVRVAAQGELSTMTSIDEWVELVGGLEVRAYNVLLVITDFLIHYIEVAPPPHLFRLVGTALSGESPLSGHRELCRRVLESVIVNHRAGYRSKVDLFLQLLDMETPTKLPRLAMIYTIRALAALQAKRAITYYERLLGSGDSELVFEVIKALRASRDRKAAPYLERLFESPVAAIAAAAVEAYGEIGLGNARAWRLYRLYPTASPVMRRSIHSALLQIKPDLASSLLAKLYHSEADPELKYQILRRLCQLQVPSTGHFLLNLADQEKNHRLRSAAGWSLGTLPSLAILPAIKRGLKSSIPLVMKWSIMKLGQLPLEIARPLLKPLMDSDSALPPMVRQTLVETVAGLPPDQPWVTQWLVARLEADPVTRLTAIHCSLLRPSPPVQHILDRAAELGIQELEFALALLVEIPGLGSNTEVLAAVGRHLFHERYQVRYLAGRFLLHNGTQQYFNDVWARASLERGKERELMGELLARALGAETASPRWLPSSPNPDEIELMRHTLAFARTASWDLARWRDAVSLLATQPQTGGHSAHALLREFILRQERLYGEVINQLLCTETDPAELDLLREAALHRPGCVGRVTLSRLFHRVTHGDYPDPSAALRILAAHRPPWLLHDFLAWIAASLPSPRRHAALEALSSWLDGLGAEAVNG